MRICCTQLLRQVKGKQEGPGFPGWDQKKETAIVHDTGIQWEQEIRMKWPREGKPWEGTA